MFFHMRSKLTSLILLALISSMSNAVHATLIKSYDFNGDLSDTLSNGLDLIASGGSVSGGRYNFIANQGLQLNSALLDTSDYGIEIGFQIADSTDGWNKLIDFQNLSSDHGMYVHQGNLQFYSAGGPVGVATLNTDMTLGLYRSGGIIELLLNGTSISTFSDFGQGVSAPNILHFFEDDFVTAQQESFVGSVDFIRIHDDKSTFGTLPIAMPEPHPLILIAIGLAALVYRRTFK